MYISHHGSDLLSSKLCSVCCPFQRLLLNFDHAVSLIQSFDSYCVSERFASESDTQVGALFVTQLFIADDLSA